jgi:hypothetical protein
VTVKSYNPSGSTCSADLTATTSVLKVPAALDGAEGATVSVVGDAYGATVSLPPRTEAGGKRTTASGGWAGSSLKERQGQVG